MSILHILLTLIVLLNLYFLVVLLIDLKNHKNEIMSESANTKLLPFSSFIIFLFSTFGVSDFAVSTALYPKLKWVSIKKLPGTLNTQCVIPVFIMALAYIKSVQIEPKTLFICLIASVLGAYIGPRFVVKLPADIIKKVIGIALVIASVLIILQQLKVINGVGTATALTGYKLVIAAICLFIYGALNNIGIGSYAPTFVTVILLGLNPNTAFPIMMGSAAFAIPVGSAQFIKFGEYSRKITLFTSIFGILGVLVAVYMVKQLNVYYILWLVVVVLLYSAYGMLSTKE